VGEEREGKLILVRRRQVGIKYVVITGGGGSDNVATLDG
jgi:hypothetical protein